MKVGGGYVTLFGRGRRNLGNCSVLLSGSRGFGDWSTICAVCWTHFGGPLIDCQKGPLNDKGIILTSIIEIRSVTLSARAFLCLENSLQSKSRDVALNLHLHYIYFSGIIFLVRNYVGQQGS